jgi:hypothetical protein
MDMMELHQALQLLRSGRPAPFRWMSTLRTHCLALCDADPNLLAALSVTTQITGDDPAEVEAVRWFSQLLAGEFGLTATVTIVGRAVSVRFARTPSAEGTSSDVAGRPGAELWTP